MMELACRLEPDDLAFPELLNEVSRTKRVRRKHHEIIKQFRCLETQCSSVYGSSRSLRLHVRKVHLSGWTGPVKWSSLSQNDFAYYQQTAGIQAGHVCPNPNQDRLGGFYSAITPVAASSDHRTPVDFPESLDPQEVSSPPPLPPLAEASFSADWIYLQPLTSLADGDRLSSVAHQPRELVFQIQFHVLNQTCAFKTSATQEISGLCSAVSHTISWRVQKIRDGASPGTPNADILFQSSWAQLTEICLRSAQSRIIDGHLLFPLRLRLLDYPAVYQNFSTHGRENNFIRTPSPVTSLCHIFWLSSTQLTNLLTFMQTEPFLANLLNQSLRTVDHKA
ncbi:MAG: hypothetical protein Q8P67_13625 [archaeon]|nr:hypothetical protein [archaeon]